MLRLWASDMSCTQHLFIELAEYLFRYLLRGTIVWRCGHDTWFGVLGVIVVVVVAAPSQIQRCNRSLMYD